MAFLTLQYHISIRAEFCRGSWLLMSNCSLPRGGSWFSIIANPRPSVCKSHCPALIGPWPPSWPPIGPYVSPLSLMRGWSRLPNALSAHSLLTSHFLCFSPGASPAQQQPGAFYPQCGHFVTWASGPSMSPPHDVHITVSTLYPGITRHNSCPSRNVAIITPVRLSVINCARPIPHLCVSQYLNVAALWSAHMSALSTDISPIYNFHNPIMNTICQ